MVYLCLLKLCDTQIDNKHELYKVNSNGVGGILYPPCQTHWRRGFKDSRSPAKGGFTLRSNKDSRPALSRPSDYLKYRLSFMIIII